MGLFLKFNNCPHLLKNFYLFDLIIKILLPQPLVSRGIINPLLGDNFQLKYFEICAP